MSSTPRPAAGARPFTGGMGVLTQRVPTFVACEARERAGPRRASPRACLGAGRPAGACERYRVRMTRCLTFLNWLGSRMWSSTHPFSSFSS